MTARDSGGADGIVLNVGIHPTTFLKRSERPEHRRERRREVGICISGGGTRSLSAALGQLRGLRQMGWMEQVHTISAVSGGCWAAALFTFLPETITYDDFLGAGAPPEALTWEGGEEPGSLSYLSPNSLGRVATSMGWEAFYDIYRQLRESGFRAWHELWRIFIGELVFKAYGLYHPDADQSPTRWYARTCDQFKRTIAPYNPELHESDFYFARQPWPDLIMNGSMFYPDGVNALIPLVSTSSHIGIRSLFADEA